MNLSGNNYKILGPLSKDILNDIRFARNLLQELKYNREKFSKDLAFQEEQLRLKKEEELKEENLKLRIQKEEIDRYNKTIRMWYLKCIKCDKITTILTTPPEIYKLTSQKKHDCGGDIIFSETDFG